MQYDIIRAWKDEEYRQSLSQEQQESLPECPAGAVELSDASLESVTGGCGGSHHWRNGQNNEAYTGNVTFKGSNTNTNVGLVNVSNVNVCVNDVLNNVNILNHVDIL